MASKGGEPVYFNKGVALGRMISLLWMTPHYSIWESQIKICELLREKKKDTKLRRVRR